MKPINEVIQHAEISINEILAELNAAMKEQGLRVSGVSVDRYEVEALGRLETNLLFQTKIDIEPRRP